MIKHVSIALLLAVVTIPMPLQADSLKDLLKETRQQLRGGQ